ncbi:MAG: RNA polymerase sigma factor [Patescibacteria group bacterium]|nr:RNA polymerase sigma factor [Patescibacteria group bacterium]
MSPKQGEQTDFEQRSDEDLVGLVSEDKELYSYLVRRYESRLLRYIVRISGVDRDDAEDILQESFINAYRNLCGFDRERKFSSWIYRITHNSTISDARRRKVRQRHLIPDVEAELVERIASDEDVARDAERKMEAEEVRGMLAELNERHRDILVLYYLEQMSYTEISDVLHVPVGTVGTRLMRAKKAFRKIIVK